MKAKDEELEQILRSHRTVIRVIGTGGAGNNTLTRLAEVGINGVETIAINTDAQSLLHTKADNKILIGKNISNGLGSGSDPQIGEDAAREDAEEIKKSLEGSDMVFVTCGLGGGTGTGSAPVIAEIAKSLNALTISVVTLPFSEEGSVRKQNAIAGLERLRANSDTVIVVQNDKLLDIVPDLPLNAAFKVADEVLVNAVKGITELVTEKGLINLDFSDVRSVMKDGSTAMIGIGESDSENKAEEAVARAVENPLLDVDITGAKSALIHITGDETISIRDAKNIIVSIAKKLAPDAKLIWGARIDANAKGKIKVLLIATGLQSDRSEQRAASTPMIAEPKASVPSAAPAPTKQLFDIKDTPKIAVTPEETIKTEFEEPMPQVKPQKVFDQIFLDEIKGDLHILKESIKKLEENSYDEKVFRNIKNACMALQNSAQMFSNQKFEEFTLFIGEFVEELLTKKIKITNGFLPYFRKIPKILDGIIANDSGAIIDAQHVIEKLTLLIDQQDNRPMPKPKPARPLERESANILKDELKIEQKEVKTRLRMDVN
ncbi:MAG: cell division protein FtsZ [candidate division KSB1 bacterium]|nr:cell division protein FtsZ [candidate division KSB1 bacterium]